MGIKGRGKNRGTIEQGTGKEDGRREAICELESRRFAVTKTMMLMNPVYSDDSWKMLNRIPTVQECDATKVQ